MSSYFFKIIGVGLLFFTSALGHYAFSGNTSEMQRRLNEQVLSKSFSVADEATLNANLNAATERGKPTHIASSASTYGYYNSYNNPYYNAYNGYGFGGYRPYYSYRPYYGGYW